MSKNFYMKKIGEKAKNASLHLSNINNNKSSSSSSGSTENISYIITDKSLKSDEKKSNHEYEPIFNT